MHLWPSMRIRDSFKLSYLKNLEWNLHRMRIEESSNSCKENLLDNTKGNRRSANAETPSSKKVGALDLCAELFMILSCCYCCFCCGACMEDEKRAAVLS